MFHVGRALKSILDMQTLSILDFKLLPCSECCVLSFGWFPGVWILLFLLFYKIQAPGNPPRERIQHTLSSWCSQNLLHMGVFFNSHALLQCITSFEYVVTNCMFLALSWVFILIHMSFFFTIDLPCLVDCPVCVQNIPISASPCVFRFACNTGLLISP